MPNEIKFGCRSLNRLSPLVCLIVVLAYVTIQSFGVSNSLFPADDAGEFAFVNGLDSPWRLLGSDVFGLFRPVKNLLFHVFAKWLPDVWSCRLLAILIGVCTFFPVRSFFRRAFGRESLSVAASAIWLLSPTLVSSVAWLSCVNIQLMCGFAAAALSLYDQDTRRSQMLAGVLLFLALISYEGAVAVGPIIVAFDFFLRTERLRRRRTWVAYGAYALVTLGYLVIRHLIGSGTSVNGSFDAVSRPQIMVASAYFTWQHFVSWLWPFGRFAVFGGYRPGDASVWLLAGSWLGILLMAVASLRLRRKAPFVAFGLATALLGFVPVSNLAGLGNGPYGDYYLGLSSLGFAMMVSEVIARSARAKASWRIPGLVFSLALLGWRGGAAVAAAQWASLWGDGMSAYAESAGNFDRFFGNLQKLAELSCNAGDWEEVQRTCGRLERMLSPNSHQLMTVYHVRALQALIRDQQADAALEFVEKALSVARTGTFEHHYHYVRGCVFEDLLNDKVQAFEEYRLSLEHRFDVDSVDAANRLARLLALDGQMKAAIGLWEKARRITPNNVLVLQNLKRAYESAAQGALCD